MVTSTWLRFTPETKNRLNRWMFEYIAVPEVPVEGIYISLGPTPVEMSSQVSVLETIILDVDGDHTHTNM